MTAPRTRPSRLLKLGFKAPVWLYQAHLGFLFGGRLIAIVHRGRKSGKRYVSGLEILERQGGELLVFSAWGVKADWYRNIEANGVDELWDGRKRFTEVPFRIVTSDEAYQVLAAYEQAHRKRAQTFLPRMLPGYDFSDESRRQLADLGVIVAFTPALVG
jgi:deazaflavin-dependent oxidoreductase (nitroreductase family)